MQRCIMQSPVCTPRPSDKAVELGRVVERGIKDSRAIDTEVSCLLLSLATWSGLQALCILSGKKVTRLLATPMLRTSFCSGVVGAVRHSSVGP
jgi:exosome complex RNA-binding protein Rrp42 (RNase PH superfamily)